MAGCVRKAGYGRGQGLGGRDSPPWNNPHPGGPGRAHLTRQMAPWSRRQRARGPLPPPSRPLHPVAPPPRALTPPPPPQVTPTARTTWWRATWRRCWRTQRTPPARRKRGWVGRAAQAAPPLAPPRRARGLRAAAGRRVQAPGCRAARCAACASGIGAVAQAPGLERAVLLRAAPALPPAAHAPRPIAHARHPPSLPPHTRVRARPTS